MVRAAGPFIRRQGPLGQRFRLRKAIGHAVQVGEIILRLDDVGMVLGQLFFTNRQGTLVARFRLSGLPGLLAQAAHVVQADGQAQVLAAQQVLADRQRLAETGLGFLQLGLFLVEHSQVVPAPEVTGLFGGKRPP